MSNDTSVFPVGLLENAVTRPIAYRGEEVSASPKRSADEVPISNELFMFDLLDHTDCGRMVRYTEVIHDGHVRISTREVGINPTDDE
jgi:hypothetical protein